MLTNFLFLAGLELLVSGRLGILLEYLKAVFKYEYVFATDLAFILAFHHNLSADSLRFHPAFIPRY
jgi:hypothetical protein